MRQIKFRGIDIETGAIRYGYLVVYDDTGHSHWLHPTGGERNYPVKPDSIAQLVGYDKDGKEVYEGDILAREFDEYKAHLGSFATAQDGCYITASQIATSTLKEV